MARIFISGSSTGLGLMAGQLLAEQGHQVVLHARDGTRANDAGRVLPQAEAVVVGDLETIAGAREVAQALVDEAHQTCAYSKATRGNIDVVINLV